MVEGYHWREVLGSILGRYASKSSRASMRHLADDALVASAPPLTLQRCDHRAFYPPTITSLCCSFTWYTNAATCTVSFKSLVSHLHI